MNEFDLYEILSEFREPLIEKMIESLDIKPDSRGIDLGCGIGYITNLLSKKLGINNELVGLDYSKKFIEYAKKNTENENIRFVQGDIRNLEFDSNTFDWAWSMDTLWVGPKEYGCPDEEPKKMMSELHRILKPGGKLIFAFWSAHKFLPGFPLLEARLNATKAANLPNTDSMDTNNHIFLATKWLCDAGFKSNKVKSFIADVSAPLNINEKYALFSLFQMLWANSEKEISKEEWEKYIDLCSPKSSKFILNNQDYYGFYVYTLFQGIKE